MSGTFEQHVDGTLLRLKSGMHPFVVVFMTVWVAAVAFGGGTFLLSAAQGRLQGNPAAAFIPALMLVFAVGLVQFGRYLARDEERFLVAFVAEMLDARLEMDVYSGPMEAE